MVDFYSRALAYLEPLQPALPEFLLQIKSEGLEQKVPIIRDDMGVFLRMICSLIQPASILELGSGISYATHWMLLGSSDSRVVAVDYNIDRIEQSRGYLERSGFIQRVELKQCWVEDFFLNNQQRFDLILQDSTKKGYLGMIEDCFSCLKPGGVMIVDNIFYNSKVFGLTPGQERKYAAGVASLKAFNEKMSLHPGFDCSFLPLSDGVLVARRIG